MAYIITGGAARATLYESELHAQLIPILLKDEPQSKPKPCFNN